MKIVIAGAGSVGTHLATLLSGEAQDIILLDESEERLSSLESNFDLLTMVASPTSLKDLETAQVGSADLFVAVTPNESRNILACQLAHYLGAKKTVARVDHYELQTMKSRDMFKTMGIDSLIYPELLAAMEILNCLKFSWVRQWWDFSEGALVLIGVKIRENAELCNIPLCHLGTDIPYHIVAIKRENETLIPSGSDSIEPGDIVYFMTTRDQIPYIQKIAGKDQHRDIKNVIIMGGSPIAVCTALELPSTMGLKIIEINRDRCFELTEKLDDDVMIINGDGRDLSLLSAEGLSNSSAFIALSQNSETNILACLAAKRFGVPKTIAQVENLDYINMAERLDISGVINKKKIAASHIYQMMLNADVSNVKCLTFANADVAEFHVAEGAKITKNQIKDVRLPHGITIGGLIRGGVGMLVTGNTRIQSGDNVVVFCLGGMIKGIERYFT